MTDKTEKKTEKRDAFSAVMIVQFVACAVILVAIFVLCRGNGASAQQIRSKYNELMSRDFSAEDYKGAYSSVSSFIKGTGGRGESEPDDFSVRKNEPPTGGEDIASGVLDVLEGVSFEKYTPELKFRMPVDDYYISSDFGYRCDPITKENSALHTGLDMAASGGSPIKAVYSGKVIKSEYSQGYGNYILISHGRGIETLYAHCSSLEAEVGDTVDSGDIIALVGSTGNSTGNHLHFEVRKNGVRLDPAYALGL